MVARNKFGMTKSLIKLEDIHKTYVTGPIHYEALKGVSLEVRPGDFVAIMGPSGSGKSTLMHIIGALDTPTSGHYFLKGRDISSYQDDELASIRNKEIGFVFQSFNLLARTSVLKNVERPLMYGPTIDESDRHRRAMACLDLVGLADKANNLSNHISGGQIQRVAIARSLVMEPAIILADEPTGNLDTKTAHEIMKLFQQLNRQGRTIVLITHEEDIAAFAKKIVHLKDGLIVNGRLKKAKK